MSLATYTWHCKEQPRRVRDIVGNALRLLEACDFLQRDWLEAETDRPINPEIVRQLDEVAIEALMRPEFEGLSSEFHSWCQAPEPKRKFPIFLATSVLLHNIDLITNREVRLARRHSLKTPYADPAKVQDLQMSANSLLCCAHGHCRMHPEVVPDLGMMIQTEAREGDHWNLVQIKYMKILANYHHGQGIEKNVLVLALYLLAAIVFFKFEFGFFIICKLFNSDDWHVLPVALRLIASIKDDVAKQAANPLFKMPSAYERATSAASAAAASAPALAPAAVPYSSVDATTRARVRSHLLSALADLN
ncbi:hypothetical protein E0Z10_g2366 [Xylaria hypoxylon]|uniref:Uncharacterized protein n=1 Tax=Xylaria hypoxylon TaxID=37992 RepID=A0A4Z0YQV0_9PEZI|nr:hypothetical protein E0Z10_g2366 [Xylaria hypoxylon]